MGLDRLGALGDACGDDRELMAICGGFLEVRNSTVVILGDVAEQARARAEQSLKEAPHADDAQAALRRATVRLDVAKRGRRRASGDWGGGVATEEDRLAPAGPDRYTGTDMSDPLDLLSRITIDPEQCGGRPCVRNMRIRVSDVLGLLAAGDSIDEILSDYPYLERDDIAACLQYAARRIDHPVLAA
jgi:uncharacterized protein (DUF433 family)